MDVSKKRDKKAVTKKPAFLEKPQKSKSKERKSDIGVVDFTKESSDQKGKKQVGQKRSSSQRSAPKKFDKSNIKSEGSKSFDKSDKKFPKKQESKEGASKLRREKAKVSELIKKLRINYNKLLLKKRDLKQSTESKKQIVQECQQIIGEKYELLVYKHDGCRILQAMIKHGSIEQKETIINQIKAYFIQMTQQKYSYHLAMKSYYYSPNFKLKQYFHQQIAQNIGKLIMHQFASEVIEFVYCQLQVSSSAESEKARQNMISNFYGQYFLLMSQAPGDDQITMSNEMTLKEFLEQKPLLADKILGRIEQIVQKLVEKGMSRHSIVQAIMRDYVHAQKDFEKVKWLAEEMKEKLPSLLASKPGLEVACSLFNILDAKDRKIVVKSIQEPLKEMIVNKVAHLFIVHILNQLDDTVLSKKKIINDILLTIDDNIADRSFQNIFLGIYAPKSKRFFEDEDIQAFDAYQQHSTSKKDEKIRRTELIQGFLKPLEKFFEEHMQEHLLTIVKCPLLVKTFACRIEQGEISSSEAINEMLHIVTKKENYDENDKSGPQILLGHPDIHRSLKELVKTEAELDNKDLQFSTKLFEIIKKNMEQCLNTRATWIIVEMLEHDNTKKIVVDQLKKQIPKIKELLQKSQKEKKPNKGLQIILEKLN